MSVEKRAQAEEWLRQAHLLSEALPFMQRYAGKTVVVKYGGHAMRDAAARASFAQDVVLLQHSGVRVVVVHGGAPRIQAMLERLGLASRFADGLRVSDKDTVEIAEMVLCGGIGKELAWHISRAGGKGVGISGKDASLVTAVKMRREAGQEDLGFVGVPERVNTGLLLALLDNGMIPVVAPIGIDGEGATYNINADTMAGALAVALKAARLLLLTDVAGVLDAAGALVEELDLERAEGMLAGEGVIAGGMIPKLRTAVDAVKEGVEASVILDGRANHALLLELFTSHGAGTLIRR